MSLLFFTSLLRRDIFRLAWISDQKVNVLSSYLAFYLQRNCLLSQLNFKWTTFSNEEHKKKQHYSFA